MKSHTRVLAIAGIVAIAMLNACATTATKINSDPVAQAGIAAVVDVAVGEAVQQGISPATLADIAGQLKAFDTGQAVTIPALTAEIQTLVLQAKLNPGQVAAVTILETTLNAVISQQLQASSSGPGGALNPDTITTINLVLSDIVTAAQIYGAQPVKPVTDIPPRNTHFVLAAVESPYMVGASASLVLVTSLQAFAHVETSSPVAAAITVLFTVGAAALDNLLT